MPGRRPDFREGKPAEAVARAVARLAELTAQIAHLRDNAQRLRAEIASHLVRLEQERDRASKLASGVMPGQTDGSTDRKPDR